MNPQWREALFAFIKLGNEIETEPDPGRLKDRLFALIDDPVYAKHEERRIQRLKAWHEERCLTPQKSESKVKLVSARQTGELVEVRFVLNRSFSYLCLGKPFLEQRRETRVVRLAKSGGKWRIAEAELPLDEKRYVPAPHELAPAAGAPAPYINPRLSASAGLYPRAVRYDREKAKAYADRWWDQANPEFKHFAVDCTNFVSQCLYAGNAPMLYTGKRASGWWYRGGSGQELWSFSWAVSNSLRLYLQQAKSGLRAETVDSPEQLGIGDVIFYDWDGDGRFQHSVIVTAKDARGMPLVNAHTVNSRRRYWDYRDSYAWSEKTKYRFCRIADVFN